jgi:hypothetical protein
VGLKRYLSIEFAVHPTKVNVDAGRMARARLAAIPESPIAKKERVRSAAPAGRAG